MLKKSLILLGVFIMVIVSASTKAGLPNVTPEGKPFPSLAPMLKQINPAVVNIVRQLDSFTSQTKSFTDIYRY